MTLKQWGPIEVRLFIECRGCGRRFAIPPTASPGDILDSVQTANDHADECDGRRIQTFVCCP